MRNVLGWASSAVALLGPERTSDLLQGVLRSEPNCRRTLSAAIEAAIALRPREEREDWRCRVPMLGCNMNHRGFLREAQEVYDVLLSGTIEAHIREQGEREQREARADPADLAPPAPSEGEAFDEYRDRLDAWASDKSEKLLTKMDFDSYSLAAKALGEPAFDAAAFFDQLSVGDDGA